MFSNVKNGWATFKFLNFTGYVSYLTNPVDELLDLIINEDSGIVRCDEEGSFFDIVFSSYDIYVVSFKNEAKIYYNPNETIEDFAKELISDVERDFEAWCKWDIFADSNEEYEEQFKENAKRLTEKLDKIKEKILAPKKSDFYR